MDVKQLIKKLEKMPQNLPVYFSDHDHGEFEVNSMVYSVELKDKSGLDPVENGFYTTKGFSSKKVHSDHEQERWDSTPNKYVNLRA